MKRYKQLTKFSESLRLSDLMKDAGISALTKKFKKRRSGLLGAESRNAKLLDCEIDETKNHITFVWLTIVTPDHELYGDDPTYNEVRIEGSKALRKNRSKTYEMKIRILDFLDWLDTYPDKSTITTKDVKDILNISNIQVSCNCPMYQYQGANWKISSVFDGSIYPTSIPDPVWGPRHGDNALVCKHLSSLLAGIRYWQNSMASMLTKKLKQRGLI